KHCSMQGKVAVVDHVKDKDKFGKDLHLLWHAEVLIGGSRSGIRVLVHLSMPLFATFLHSAFLTRYRCSCSRCIDGVKFLRIDFERFS
ncbi:hypothetical protein VIGAN_08234300, partial [Vigna angularis var. angularis]